MTNSVFDLSAKVWTFEYSLRRDLNNALIVEGSGDYLSSEVEVPVISLSDSQADFDSWLNAQSITQAYEENVTKCIAQMTTQAPFSDEKSSLTIAHDCEAKLQITLTFPSFSGKFLTDSGNHGEGCSLTEGSLVC
jgi:hypothetical protein